MTKEKIGILLDKLGVSNGLDKWIKLPQVSTIYLNQDSNILVDLNMLFYFDSTSKILRISEGTYKNLSKIENENNAEAYPTTVFCDFDSIGGFITTTVQGPYGTYYTKKF